jgi:pyridoxal phosphate enzyme (YggS family)
LLKQRVEVFIEINTSGEASKFGAPPNQAAALARQIAALPNLQLTGLMTIGALTEDQAAIRRCFRQLRELREEIAAINLPNVNIRHLSMGMTDDFELAVAEGSTMVRIGRAIFGARH